MPCRVHVARLNLIRTCDARQVAKMIRLHLRQNSVELMARKAQLKQMRRQGDIARLGGVADHYPAQQQRPARAARRSGSCSSNRATPLPTVPQPIKAML